MYHTMRTLLLAHDFPTIAGALAAALERSDEALIWKQKSLPYARAILSVLLPLRDQKLLFDPEGNPHEVLTPELFVRWCDLLSLKTLAFTLARSNETRTLQRTRFSPDRAGAYRPVDLEELGKYLASYNVNLENEWVDFPITNYNLHIGITSLISKLLHEECR